MYDWIAATAISRKISTKTTSPGRNAATAYPSPRVNITKLNPIRTFIRVCPAIILANNRIPKLIGLKKYDINSTGTSKNPNKKEVLSGKNNEKKFEPCKRTEIMLIPIKIAILNAKVTTIWLVKVKLYGINPIKFNVTMKINNDKINIIINHQLLIF